MLSNNKTSVLVSSQVPAFVKDDHTTFVQFLEDYYKFMELETGVTNISKNLNAYQDVDIASGIYLQELYDTFISLLPEKVLADKSFILKHVKDFYRARGSEKSVRFLLRILLNKEISFYYPKRDILKASDGKYYIQKSVRIGDINVNNVSNTIAYSHFVSKQVTGTTSRASAIVEQIDRYYDKGELVTELRLSNEYRNFINGETVFCYYEEEGEVNYLSGNLFSGSVISVSLANGGFGYTEGVTVPIVGGGGSGAQAIISSISKGALGSIGIQAAGAGFQTGDSIIITGGGGSGAAAVVGDVDLSETYHPKSYSIVATQIAVEANTPVNNTRYSNCNPSIVNPYLHPVANSMSYWTYDNCGPLQTCTVTVGGNDFSGPPTMDVQSNNTIRLLGILGRMEIVSGGHDYQVGDELVFTNPPGCYGLGAAANVTSVGAGGNITGVRFYQVPGHITGGSGYNSQFFPEVTVTSGSGAGAQILVKAILGDGESLISSSGPSGQILELKLISGGVGYTTAPSLDFANLVGSGAIATAAIVSGAYTYPGRFLNDDGMLSSYNFLEDRDYYQNYSYVIRVDEPIGKYRKAIFDLVHPAGMKLFGEYLLKDPTVQNLTFSLVTTMTNSIMKLASYNTIIDDIIMDGDYTINTLGATYTPKIIRGSYNVSPTNNSIYSTTADSIIVYRPVADLSKINKGSSVYLEFNDAYPNLDNRIYTVSSANNNYFTVPVANSNTALFHRGAVTSNLTISTGSGTTNSYCELSQFAANSDPAIAVGDSLTVGAETTEVVYTSTDSVVIYVYPKLTGGLSGQAVDVTKKPYYPSGRVTVYNPKITVLANNTGLIRGDEAYFSFLSDDTTLQNTSYNIISANVTQVTIVHKAIEDATSFSGTVDVQTANVTITSTGHGVNNNESVFINFATGDTDNAVSGFYTATGVTENSFNVKVGHSVVSGGNAYLITPNLTVTITDHGFSTYDNVRVWFITGDTANVANGDYQVTVRNANEFFFEVPDFVLANGTVSVYRNYCNVIINKVGHGYNAGDYARILLETGNTDRISNGVYQVESSNSNYFTIKHTGVNVSSNIANLLPDNTGTLYV